MSIGLITKKTGCSAIFDENGVRVPVTLLEVLPSSVIGFKTKDKDGYNAVVVGSLFRSVKKIKKPQRGMFNKLEIDPCDIIKEFRLSSLDDDVSVGSKVCAKLFNLNQKVDVTAYSVGKGFAGGMKRHNFSGLRASHGVSASHRSLGSTGQCQDPGKVFKGKKMAGHLGNVKATIQNLKIVFVNYEKNLLAVCGSVPGKSGGLVVLRDAVK